MEQKRPTEEQINNLKQDWLYDACWDIEDTPGFESIREELKEFADKQREIWRKRAEERRKKEAEWMGVEVDSPLFRYLSHLENRIKYLEQKVFGE